MAEQVFYSILRATNTGEPESLEFTNLTPEDSALVLESLFDPRNNLERRSFR